MSAGTGTTINADRSTGWVARPHVARAIRWVVVGAPILASVGAAIAVRAALPAASSVSGSVAAWVAATACSLGVLIGMQRLARRLLPLEALYRLSLVFPDRTPSRFRIGLSTGTTAQLQRRIDAARTGVDGETVDEAACRLIELVALLGAHDRMTRGHSERVRAYTHMIADEMGIVGDDLERLKWSALLHDIGKIAVPGRILNKAAALTEAEWTHLRTHPTEGASLVAPLVDWLGDWSLAVSEHHESFDGSGYPRGLAGAEISLAGRIVAVADAYDVMTSARSYKVPMSAEDARAELSRCAGTQFDPDVVRAFLHASTGDSSAVSRWLAALAHASLLPQALIGPATAGGAVAAIGTVAAVGSLVAPLPLDTAQVFDREFTVPSDTAGVVTGEDSTDATDPAAQEGSEGSSDAGVPTSDGPPETDRDGDDANRSPQADSPDSVIDVSPTTVAVTDETPEDAAVGDPSPDLPSGTIPAPSTPVTTGTTPPDTVPMSTLVLPVDPTVPSVDPSVPAPPPPAVAPSEPVLSIDVPAAIEVTVPPVTIALEVAIPDATVLAVDVDLPAVTVPPISLPPVTIPAVTVPPVTIPPVTVPPVTVPPVTLPEVIATVLPAVTVPPISIGPISLPGL